MRILLAIGICLCPVMASFGASSISVQNALKLLPKDQAKNLVRIEAREGDLAPERWYFQVYDPGAENGLREFAVSGKDNIASRTISQFLTGAKPDDVIGLKGIKMDSDDLVKLVKQYAEANHATVNKVNFTLMKEATDPLPVWKLACFDEAGKKFAELVINSKNMNVVSHEGFDSIPARTVEATPTSVAENASKPLARERPSKPVRPKPTVVETAAPTPRKPFFQRLFGGGDRNNQTPQPSNR